MLGPTYGAECQAHHDFQTQTDLKYCWLMVLKVKIITLVATYDCDRYRDCLAKTNIVAFDLFEYVHLNLGLQLGLPKIINKLVFKV